jgi:hypothetical protein
VAVVGPETCLRVQVFVDPCGGGSAHELGD